MHEITNCDEVLIEENKNHNEHLICEKSNE